jgi:hypothetical protein
VAAPVYESTTVTDFSVDATSHNANMPATVNAGDLLLAIASFDTATTTITTPAGWTLIAQGRNNQNVSSGVYAKVAAGTEGGGTVDFATNISQRGSVHVIRASSWYGGLAGVLATIGQATSTPQTVLSTGPTAYDTLWVTAQAKGSVTAWGAGPPTGYSNNTKTGVSEDTGVSASIASATRTATANFETVTTVWLSGSSIETYVIAILPTDFAGPTAAGGSTPTYESTTVTDFSSDTTAHAANMPATVNAGDLLVAFAAFDMTALITTPAGWTNMLANGTNSALVGGVFAKVAAGNEGGTTVDFATDTAQRGSVHVIRVSSWAGVLAGVQCSLDTIANTNFAVALGIGDTAHNALWIAAEQKSSLGPWSGGAPTNYINSNLTNASEDSTTSASIASATRALAANQETILSTGWNATEPFEFMLVRILPTATFGTAPTISSVTVGYGALTRTGPNNTPWTLTFTATDPEETGADALTWEVWTGAGRTGTMVASGTCTSAVSRQGSIAYNASGIVDGSQTLRLSVDDGTLTSADSSFTLKRDDVAPTAATAIVVTP